MNVQTVQPVQNPETCCTVSTHAKVATTLHWIAAAIVMIYCLVCIWYYVFILSVLAIAAIVCFAFAANGRSHNLLVVYMVYLCLYEILLGISLAIAIRISSSKMRGVSILSAADVLTDGYICTDYYDSYYDEYRYNCYYDITIPPDTEILVARIGIGLISAMLVFNIYELVVLSFYLNHLKSRGVAVPVVTAQILQPYLQPQYPQNQFPVQNPPFGQNQVVWQNVKQMQYTEAAYTPQQAPMYPTNAISAVAYPSQGLP